MNILKHKSWNVWNQDNKEKVKRDEEIQSKKEGILKERRIEDGKKRRMQELLKRKNRIEGEESNEKELDSLKEEDDCVPLNVREKETHLDLIDSFGDNELQLCDSKTKNLIQLDDREQKDDTCVDSKKNPGVAFSSYKRNVFEKKNGVVVERNPSLFDQVVLNPLELSSVNLHQNKANSSEEKQQKRKDKKMKKGRSSKKRNRGGDVMGGDTSKPKKKKSMEELRNQRIKRETKEKERIQELLNQEYH